MSREDAKKMAAQSALTELPESGVVGLGSGSTAKIFIGAVADLVSALAQGVRGAKQAAE